MSALLDEHLPGWAKLSPREVRLRLAELPGRLRADVRAAYDAQASAPPLSPAAPAAAPAAPMATPE